MLYDDGFIDALPKIKPGWKNPLILYVIRELTEEHRDLKALIEKWYARISDEKKLNIAVDL